jgi:hypothetical protein
MARHTDRFATRESLFALQKTEFTPATPTVLSRFRGSLSCFMISLQQKPNFDSRRGYARPQEMLSGEQPRDSKSQKPVPKQQGRLSG